MREKLIGQIQHGAEGLDELPRAAIERLMPTAKVAPHQRMS
jgi:hypothetical protein